MTNFYQIDVPEYTVIVAQTQEGTIVMERQYKHAVGKIILNLPSGYLESNESPLNCAQCELLEETVFKAESWCHLGSFCVDGNRGCGKMHAFVAFVRIVLENLRMKIEKSWKLYSRNQKMPYDRFFRGK